MAVIILLGAIRGAGGNKSSSSVKNSPGTQTESNTQSKSQSKSEEKQDEVIEYTHYNVSEMMDDLDSNPMKAQNKYKDQCIEITGRLNVIDSDGKYISVTRDDDEWAILGIHCTIKNDEQRAQIMEMSIGDTVTLRGKCTDVGEVLGYYLDIDSIE